MTKSKRDAQRDAQRDGSRAGSDDDSESSDDKGRSTDELRLNVPTSPTIQPPTEK